MSSELAGLETCATAAYVGLREGDSSKLRSCFDVSKRTLISAGAPGIVLREPKEEIIAVEHSVQDKKRLKVLWQYDVPDTVPEEVFDDLTELAARICEAPIALISLVDENRQWFKSKVGITVNETSRDISFCSHAIQQEGLFIVPDAMKDKRFAHNPLVTSDPKIRFYAGAPLVTPDGHALGTLCVIDKVPRELRPEQQQALRVLARHVMTQLELRRHATELAAAHKAREATHEKLEKAEAEVASLKRQLADLSAQTNTHPPQKAGGASASSASRKNRRL